MTRMTLRKRSIRGGHLSGVEGLDKDFQSLATQQPATVDVRSSTLDDCGRHGQEWVHARNHDRQYASEA